MVNISKIISTLSRLEGCSTRVTLSGKQFLQIAEKGNPGAKVSEVISGIVAKNPKLKADVAYKVSEQGFTVGAVTLRNGKEVVGRGAVSVTGLGTEEAIIKTRLNVGKNGEIAQMSGWNNFAHSPRIQDYELATSLKNGVVETYAKAGEFGSSRSRINIPAAIDAAGLTEEAALAMKKGNNFLDQLHKQVRNLFAGKEVDMTVPTFQTSNFKKVNNKNLNFDDISKKLQELSKKEYLENCYKMQNWEMVNKADFSKTMEEYFRLSSKGIKETLSMGDTKLADIKIKELRNLAKQVKEQTGYEIKGDWRKYLDELSNLGIDFKN